MMGHRERVINGDEEDCFSGWRKLLCVFQRPGVAHKAKRRFSRRVRREAKEVIAAEIAIRGGE